MVIGFVVNGSKDRGRGRNVKDEGCGWSNREAERLGGACQLHGGGLIGRDFYVDWSLPRGKLLTT